MNILEGKIDNIKTSKNFSLVTIKVAGHTFKTIIVETPSSASYLIKDTPIKILFKETEVVIGKGTHHNISLQNRIEGKIIKMEIGEILSKITMETAVGEIRAIITSNAVKELKLQDNEDITAMIKTNEIMLSE